VGIWDLDLQVRVNGPEAAPVYKFLKASKPGLFGSRIKWNFTKFLVGKDGKVIERYATSTAPLSIEVSLALSWILCAQIFGGCSIFLCIDFDFAEGYPEGSWRGDATRSVHLPLAEVGACKSFFCSYI
jgi:hypothetical protein